MYKAYIYEFEVLLECVFSTTRLIVICSLCVMYLYVLGPQMIKGIIWFIWCEPVWTETHYTSRDA